LRSSSRHRPAPPFPASYAFFPFATDRIDPSGPQPITRDGDAYVLTLPVAPTLSGPLDRLAGVVTAASGFGAVRAATIDVAVAGSVAPGAKGTPAPAPALDLGASRSGAGDGVTLALAIVSALLGGLILNLMPCVFPVLTLKVLGFATHHDTRSTMRQEAVAFGAGVVLTFVALGAALAALRATGEQLGWGFSCNPRPSSAHWRSSFSCWRSTCRACSNSDSWRRPASPTGPRKIARSMRSAPGCSPSSSRPRAPHHSWAPRSGFALGAPAASMLVIFVALGIGMALPYVLFAWFPGWRRRLPRPGPWLERFKQVLAFPLYATVIWLAWVLGAQRDNDALLALLLALLGVGFRPVGLPNRALGRRPAVGHRGALVLAGAAIIAWPLFVTEPVVTAKAAGHRQRERRAMDGVHAGHGGGALPPPAGRCSSTSPPRGA
jgi:thiol:disulfide interchange protein DsbD